MDQTTANCSRDRILDAAEDAFAERGFAGASLRDIVREAQVNLATVYYYFQSKNGLMEAVLKRRLGPLRAEHLELLRRLEREGDGRPLPVEKILGAMLLPLLRLAVTEPARHQAVTRLIGRIAVEPNPQTQVILRHQRAETRAAFLKALQASLPRLRLAELERRVDFVWGALAFLMCNPHHLGKQLRGAGSAGEAEVVMAEMVNFFAPGLRTPGTCRGLKRGVAANGHKSIQYEQANYRVSTTHSARGGGGRLPAGQAARPASDQSHREPASERHRYKLGRISRSSGGGADGRTPAAGGRLH